MILLLLLLIAHAFILIRTIFYPYPELFIYPYLANKGLLPYKDILDQHFPGPMFLPINLDNLGMNNQYDARIWLIGITLITQLLIFTITKKIFNSQRKAFLASILFLVWHPFLEGWVLWIDSFMPIFLLPAFYFCYRWTIKGQNNIPLILAGVFLSLGIIIKQVAVPLAGMIFLWIYWQKRDLKPLGYYLLGLIPLLAIMTIYFIKIGVFWDFWYWNVVYNLTTYAQYGTKRMGLKGLIRIIGIISPLILMPYLRNKKLLILMLIFIIGSLAGTFDRPDFVHFQPVLPFICMTIAWVLVELWNLKLWKIKVVKVGTAIYIGLIITWLTVFYRGHISDNVLFFDPTTLSIKDKIIENTVIGEEIFLFGVSPHLYQQTQTIPAGRIFVFQFPWFIQVTEDRILMGIKDSQPNLVLRDLAVETDNQRLVIYAKKINDYINQNYQIFDKVGDVEFLKRRDRI